MVETCKKCGVLFECIENVTELSLYKSGVHGGYWFFYTQCPVCKHKRAENFHSSTHRYGWEFEKEAEENGIEVEQ